METAQPNNLKLRKLPKLTKKQAGFVKDYVAEGNGTKAALNNYEIESKNKIDVAKSIATENLTKPYIAEAVEIAQETLKSALEKQGITPAKIARKIDVLLEARDHLGNVDSGAVDKGLKHATNIYGVEDLNEKPKSQTTYNFIFNSETQEKIKKIDAEIKAQLINPNVKTA